MNSGTCSSHSVLGMDFATGGGSGGGDVPPLALWSTLLRRAGEDLEGVGEEGVEWAISGAGV